MVVNNKNIQIVMDKLEELYKNNSDAPIVSLMSERGKSPFEILISTIISLRTKDETTAKVSSKLFERANTPEKMAKIPLEEIKDIVRPAGFYNKKAENILNISTRLLKEFDGKVPNDLQTLLSFKGVGRKTANLVIVEAFDKYGICVDTHVHRISNRWGYIDTSSPKQTEFALRDQLPKKFWKDYNKWLVSFGQTLCQPISPWCSKCPIENFCEKNDVESSR